MSIQIQANRSMNQKIESRMSQSDVRNSKPRVVNTSSDAPSNHQQFPLTAVAPHLVQAIA
jgi:hypothetical protein